MKPNEIEQWISGPRFAPFLDCANGNHQHALEIYVWHANLTAACFQVVHHFEVLLRNTVDRALVSLDERTCWSGSRAFASSGIDSLTTILS